MKILIAGATGLVGNDLISLCLEKDITVNFLTSSKDKLNFRSEINGFFWDPNKGEIDTQCFDGVSTIINLAGSPIAQKWTEATKRKILQSRVDSLNTLHTGLKNYKASSVKTFITASAIGIYPDSLTTYYTESDTGVSESFAGQVVGQWEEAANKFKDEVENVAIVRIGLVLSDQGGALVKIAGAVKRYVGAAFGTGDQWQSWIQLRDLSRMFLFIHENSLNGIFNGVAPNPVTQNKLLNELAKVLKRPLIFPNIPKFALRLLFGEMSEILLSSQRVSSKKIETKGFEFRYQNICRALESIYPQDPK